jgi:tetratricopeptide (TPR) repeat protein
MRRLSLAVLLAATVLGLGLLLRAQRGHEVPEPDRDDASTRSADAPTPAEPLVAPPMPPDRTEVRTVQPSPAVPTDQPARREEADRLIAEGKVMEGIEVFREVVAADPTAKNHGDLGALLYRLTAFDEAAIHLRAAAELDPGNADRWIALANVYYRKVDPGEAWKAEKRAREAEPGLELGHDSEGMRVRKE